MIRGDIVPVPGEPPAIVLPLVEATEVFPENRTCLRTH